MDRQEDILVQAMLSDPDDWLVVLALADYYEDAGRCVEASCMRWRHENKKRPYREMCVFPNRSTVRFHWFIEKCLAGPADGQSELPLAIYTFLGRGYGSGDCVRIYELAIDAEMDFRQAWRKLFIKNAKDNS